MNEPLHPTTHEEHFEVRQEPDRVAARPILLAFAVVVVVTLATIAVQGWMLRGRRQSLGVERAAVASVAPRQIAAIHQTPIERDRHGLDLRDEQRRALQRWQWVDRERGIARVPIERAMDLVVDEARRGEGAP
ncbi:MAG: hypothetical protein NVS3B10_01090 [Polyangiales bacterium]